MTESPAMQAARDKPWQIAADLEKAALALRAAVKVLDAIVGDGIVDAGHIMLVCDTNAFAHRHAIALQALSDKYQAIADAEVVL
jgi:hypothetical protein